jgi:hypothetical protein
LAGNEFEYDLSAAWKGSNGDERIWYSFYNGVQWLPRQAFPNPDATSVRPSLAPWLVEIGELIVAPWKGGDSDERIWYSVFTNSWDPQQVVPGVDTSVGPSLANALGDIYAAWKGGDGDEKIWYSKFDGTSWDPQQVVPGVATSVGPSLAESLGYLFAAWKGGDGDERIWYSRFDGSSWAPQKAMPDPIRSSDKPSLTAYQNWLYVVWKGGDDDERIWYTMSRDGINFGFADGAVQMTLPSNVFTSGAPSLAPAFQQLYFAWKGGGNDDRIWWIAANNSG